MSETNKAPAISAEEAVDVWRASPEKARIHSTALDRAQHNLRMAVQAAAATHRIWKAAPWQDVYRRDAEKAARDLDAAKASIEEAIYDSWIAAWTAYGANRLETIKSRIYTGMLRLKGFFA